MILIAQIIIVLLGFSGFLLANYIHDTKRTSTPLVCPLEGNCETVIHSDYSKFLGIPVEVLGVLYYSVITLAYFLFAFFPSSMPEVSLYFTLILSLIAILFSIYLTAIQAFILKHWCTWCLISAGISSVIFIISYYISSAKILELVQNL
ncbi:MAG TPA: vitamin K epoxide reductase family protein [Candidatus Paceibacterota bacterium]